MIRYDPSIDSNSRVQLTKERDETIKTLMQLAQRANDCGLPGVFLIEIEIVMLFQCFPSTADELLWLGTERAIECEHMKEGRIEREIKQIYRTL